MVSTTTPAIEIDLDQFKLHLNLPDRTSLILHFDTPSRRFYLSVIALVADQLRKNSSTATVPLAEHVEILELLNETVGKGAGSSEKAKLLPRIYRKWKDALPDLENAPLFKVVGRKKRFDEGSDKVYRFDHKTKDAWANLFEYSGSGVNVRLRFSVARLGVGPNDIVLVYGDRPDETDEMAWDRFIESLQRDAEVGGRTDDIIDSEEKTEPEHNIALELETLLKEPGGIDKIPLKTRLELISRLAMAPGRASPRFSEVPDHSEKGTVPSETRSSADPGVSEVLLQNILNTGSDEPFYTAPELQDGGSSPSPRSEVYALGVLLYQMVVGDLSRPLEADWKEAVTDDVLREDIAACVETLPEKRLATPLELTRRLRTLDERRSLLLPESVLRMQNATPGRRRKRRWIAYGCAMAVILALLVFPAWYYQKMSRVEAEKKQAYETNLPKIRQLLESEKYLAAHALARETAKTIPQDPTLKKYLTDATNTLNIETMPAAATISYRPYTDFEGPWINLGVTPIKEAIVPVGMHHFKIEKGGYQERILVRPVKPRDSMAKNFGCGQKGAGALICMKKAGSPWDAFCGSRQVCRAHKRVARYHERTGFRPLLYR